MGYYSQVAIRLSKEAYNKLKGMYFLPESEFHSFDSFHFLKDETVFFKWDSVKWYEDDFEEVDAVMDFLGTLDAEKGEFYEYLRIGEDDRDEEHHSTFPVFGDVYAYEFWIERSVGILESRLGGRMDGMKELMEFEGIKKED